MTISRKISDPMAQRSTAKNGKVLTSSLCLERRILVVSGQLSVVSGQ